MTAGVSHHEKPPVGVWVSLNRVLLTLILTTTLGVLVYRLMPETSLRRQGAETLASLSEQVELQKQKVLRARREVDALARDPEYIELISREPLQLQKEGERVYRLDQDIPATPKSAKPK